MKLTYRGNSYEVPAPIELDYDSTEQPKIQLIYRGNSLDYIPCPVVNWELDKTDCSTVDLIYRGNSYERKLQAIAQAQSKAQGDRLRRTVDRGVMSILKSAIALRPKQRAMPACTCFASRTSKADWAPPTARGDRQILIRGTKDSFKRLFTIASIDIKITIESSDRTNI